MKKRLLILLALVLLSGCRQPADTAVTPTPTPTPMVTATPAPTPMVLTVCVGTEGYTLDPTYVSDVESADYMGHLFEGLTKYVPQSRGESGVTETVLAPGMAEHWERSPDGLTYTFTIRADAVWSDGKPVRAQDFVYAWRRLLTPSAADEMKHSAAAQQLFGVLKNAAEVSAGELPPSKLGVRAVSDQVLEVTLEQECSHFLKLCASTCLLPLREDIIDRYGGDWTKEGIMVGNGAFTLESLVHDDHMTLRANPLYYDAEAIGPDRILWYFSDGGEPTPEVGS